MGSSRAGGVSLHASDWSLTETDGVRGAERDALRPGVAWTWDGPLWRLDTVPAPVRLDGAIGRAALRRVAAGRAARLTRRPAGAAAPPPMGRAAPGAGPLDEEVPLRGGFVVTDGLAAWGVGRAPGGAAAREVAVFAGGVPPRGVPLWVVSVGDAPVSARPIGGGFAPGTPVETPFGAVPVERLRPGDPVLTDRGAAPLRAVRLRPSAQAVRLPAELFGAAGPPAALTLGPDTWLGLEGAALRTLFGVGEALVRAGDLAGLAGGRPERRVDLLALGVDGGGLVMAGDLPCLAGRQEACPLRALTAGEAQIAFGHRPSHLAPRPALRGAA
jgi:hypothetical protein